MSDQILGKSFNYWCDLQAVMDTHMIKTPNELDERLENCKVFDFIMPWHLDEIPEESHLHNRIKKVLLSSVGDTRLCPHCNRHFVPADVTARDAWDLYFEMFVKVAKTPLTDRFDEWNW